MHIHAAQQYHESAITAQTSLQQSCTRRDACARAVLQYGQWYMLMECVGMEKNNCVRDVTKRLGKEDECGPSARARLLLLKKSFYSELV